jgi:hypothetical protein
MVNVDQKERTAASTEQNAAVSSRSKFLSAAHKIGLHHSQSVRRGE